MSVSYPNAPLVELVAELQWPTQTSALFNGGVPVGVPIFADTSATEGFYTRFAERVEALGFRHSERLSPAGSFVPPGQAVYRFRQQVNQPPLYQVGDGLFTANGLPPTYSAWDDFSPMLQQGIEAALAARTEPEASTDFSSLSLRYINAFDASFWRGKTAAHFSSEVLGFSLSLPERVEDARAAEQSPSLNIQAVVPLQDGGSISFQLGEGVVDGRNVVILDMTLRYVNIPINAAHDRFDTAHEFAHNVFEDLTADVHDILEAKVSA